MLQELKINVPYGKKLVTDRTRLIEEGWIYSILNGEEWKQCNERQKEQWDGAIYAEDFPILEGWKLVPVGEERPEGYKFWNYIEREFHYGPNADMIVCEDDPPIIRKKITEPRVFWGEICDEVKPHYILPPFIHNGPTRSVEEWDCIPIWAKQNGLIFKGFYLDKETPMPMLYHPINMETGEVAQYAKFEKAGE